MIDGSSFPFRQENINNGLWHVFDNTLVLFWVIIHSFEIFYGNTGGTTFRCHNLRNKIPLDTTQ